MWIICAIYLSSVVPTPSNSADNQEFTVLSVDKIFLGYFRSAFNLFYFYCKVLCAIHVIIRVVFGFLDSGFVAFNIIFYTF